MAAQLHCGDHLLLALLLTHAGAPTNRIIACSRRMYEVCLAFPKKIRSMLEDLLYKFVLT